MNHVLVTGGAGFMGCNFVRTLLRADEGVQLRTLDALTYARDLINLEDLPDPSRNVFVDGDVCDQGTVEDLLRVHGIDTIIHFASETHVDRSIVGPSAFVHTNIQATVSLLEAAMYGLAGRATIGFYAVPLHING